MAFITNSFVAFLLLNFITKGLCNCTLDNINVGTVRSGREIQGQVEWNVTVINNCACAQSMIRMTCKGFQTVEAVDPSILSKEGDECVLIKGSRLNGSSSVNFSYAWYPPFVVAPISSVIDPC